MVSMGIDSKEFSDLKEKIQASTNIDSKIIDRIVDDLFNAGIIASIQSEKARNNGIKFERGLQKFLNKITKNATVSLSNNVKGDININISGKDYLVEVKQNIDAQFSSFSLQGLFKDGKFNEDFTVSKDFKAANEGYKNFIKSNKVYFDTPLTYIYNGTT